MAAVRDAFDDAGIDYAFLHGWDESYGRDSDVDLVVRREHLSAIETVIRWGTLGEIVQRFEYNVPWCRYYVLATGDSRRPFRQLDAACDPFGISHYGSALRVALDHVERVDGVPVLDAAARTLYLATKRARKGVRAVEDLDSIRAAFAEDPSEAEALLDQVWSSAGRAVAQALRKGNDLQDALDDLGRTVAKSRWTPGRIGLRLLFESRRAASRALKPTGLVVRIAGPDGVGKSTVADELERSLIGAFRRSSRLHLGPGMLPPPARLLRRPRPDASEPHSRQASGRTVSIVRIFYLGVDAALGWLPRVWIPRARSSLVLLERGWDDLLVDPKRYRLSVGSKLVKTLAHMLPRPDLTLLLSGDATAINARKPELEPSEIKRQLQTWREVLAARPEPWCEIETACSDSSAVAADAVIAALRARSGGLRAFHVARSGIGIPSATGTRYAVLPAGGYPRWLLPQRVGAVGPMRARLYRAASSRHLLGAAAMGLIQRSAGIGTTTITLDPRVGLGPEVAAALGLRSVELACLLPTDPARNARATFSALSQGRPVAIVKVGAEGSEELQRELDVLAALETAQLDHIVVPKVVASFSWHSCDVLVLSVLGGTGRTSRAVGTLERQALIELAKLTSAEVPLLRSADGGVLVHGDFCAWNTARGGREALSIWDWEWARAGLPLEDYFHWQTQRLIAFQHGTPEGLVASAIAPSAEIVELAELSGASAEQARVALRLSLEAGMRKQAGSSGPAYAVRAKMLQLLQECS